MFLGFRELRDPPATNAAPRQLHDRPERAAPPGEGEARDHGAGVEAGSPSLRPPPPLALPRHNGHHYHGHTLRFALRALRESY